MINVGKSESPDVGCNCQVNKSIQSEKGGGIRFCRQIVYWCKKQGNKFYQKRKCNSPIFNTLRLRHMLFLC